MIFVPIYLYRGRKKKSFEEIFSPVIVNRRLFWDWESNKFWGIIMSSNACHPRDLPCNYRTRSCSLSLSLTHTYTHARTHTHSLSHTHSHTLSHTHSHSKHTNKHIRTNNAIWDKDWFSKVIIEGIRAIIGDKLTWRRGGQNATRIFSFGGLLQLLNLKNNIWTRSRQR